MCELGLCYFNTYNNVYIFKNYYVSIRYWFFTESEEQKNDNFSSLTSPYPELFTINSSG